MQQSAWWKTAGDVLRHWLESGTGIDNVLTLVAKTNYVLVWDDSRGRISWLTNFVVWNKYILVKVFQTGDGLDEILVFLDAVFLMFFAM